MKFWPFKKRRRITCKFIAFVSDIKEDTYELTVCGAEESDGSPVKVTVYRQFGEEVKMMQPQYIKLTARP